MQNVPLLAKRRQHDRRYDIANRRNKTDSSSDVSRPYMGRNFVFVLTTLVLTSFSHSSNSESYFIIVGVSCQRYFNNFYPVMHYDAQGLALAAGRSKKGNLVLD